jgi:hypothetical protein
MNVSVRPRIACASTSRWRAPRRPRALAAEDGTAPVAADFVFSEGDRVVVVPNAPLAFSTATWSL